MRRRSVCEAALPRGRVGARSVEELVFGVRDVLRKAAVQKGVPQLPAVHVGLHRVRLARLLAQESRHRAARALLAAPLLAIFLVPLLLLACNSQGLNTPFFDV